MRDYSATVPTRSWTGSSPRPTETEDALYNTLYNKLLYRDAEYCCQPQSQFFGCNLLQHIALCRIELLIRWPRVRVPPRSPFFFFGGFRDSFCQGNCLHSRVMRKNSGVDAAVGSPHSAPRRVSCVPPFDKLAYCLSTRSRVYSWGHAGRHSTLHEARSHAHIQGRTICRVGGSFRVRRPFVFMGRSGFRRLFHSDFLYVEGRG